MPGFVRKIFLAEGASPSGDDLNNPNGPGAGGSGRFGGGVGVGGSKNFIQTGGIAEPAGGHGAGKPGIDTAKLNIDSESLTPMPGMSPETSPKPIEELECKPVEEQLSPEPIVAVAGGGPPSPMSVQKSQVPEAYSDASSDSDRDRSHLNQFQWKSPMEKSQAGNSVSPSMEFNSIAPTPNALTPMEVNAKVADTDSLSLSNSKNDSMAKDFTWSSDPDAPSGDHAGGDAGGKRKKRGLKKNNDLQMQMLKVDADNLHPDVVTAKVAQLSEEVRYSVIKFANVLTSRSIDIAICLICD
jgi:hypothetical protein